MSTQFSGLRTRTILSENSSVVAPYFWSFPVDTNYYTFMADTTAADTNSIAYMIPGASYIKKTYRLPRSGYYQITFSSQWLPTAWVGDVIKFFIGYRLPTDSFYGIDSPTASFVQSRTIQSSGITNVYSDIAVTNVSFFEAGTEILIIFYTVSGVPASFNKLTNPDLCIQELELTTIRR